MVTAVCVVAGVLVPLVLSRIGVCQLRIMTSGLAESYVAQGLEFVKRMMEQHRLSLSQMLLVGHSLGAHVAAEVCRMLNTDGDGKASSSATSSATAPSIPGAWRVPLLSLLC